MDKTYRAEMINGVKGCITCEHWGGKREKKTGRFGDVVECSDRFLSGPCKLHLGTFRMASFGACREYAKWHELK